MKSWNDWPIIGFLAAIAFGFYLLGIADDLPDHDKWNSAGILLVLALGSAIQMIYVAFFRKSDRK
jgi:hypothetical protein